MYKPTLKILTMLEEGTITTDEAIRLLDSLRGISNKGEFADCMEEKIQTFAYAVNSVAQDVKTGATQVYNNVKPKIKEATKTVAEKTCQLANNISQALNNDTTEI